MNFQRTDRVSEELRREIDRMIREDLHDPRIKGTYSVTRVDVGKDLRNAKVFITVLEDEYRDDLLKALKSAAGFMRRELSHRMILRCVPEMTFVSDMNIAYGVHIAKLLKEAGAEESHEQAE